MTVRLDGTATCDRCGRWMPGFGVLYGLVATHLVDGTLETLIFCYANECRRTVLAGLVNNTTSPDDPEVRCNDDGVVLASRSVDTAMLLSDIGPDGFTVRYLQLCYDGGSRAALLLNAGRTP